MKIALLFAAALLLIFIAVPMVSGPPRTHDSSRDLLEGLPWQIDILPGGNSRVFGLTIGTSTLAEARQRFGSDGEVAIVAAPGEVGSLEAYFSDVTMGAVTGKMVLTGDISRDELEELRTRNGKGEYMESTTRKLKLQGDDLNRALAMPLRAIAFIPSVNLDEAMVLQRFGPPAERIRSSETTEHFLYPQRGLDLALDTKGKELLQYVAPARFQQLREPLLASKPAG
jgi:hypothetical protein